MTAGNRCTLTELLIAECAHCQGITAALPELPPKWSGPQTFIEAAHHGTCTGCDDHIKPGDQIISDDNGGWLCDYCGHQ